MRQPTNVRGRSVEPHVITPSRNILADEEIETYLRTERRRRALAILWIGILGLAIGLPGSWLVFRWLVEGGVMLNLVLASPFLVLAGVPLTIYGLIALARSTSIRTLP
jgi:hypothetical protein